jgi:hypothetical protein
VHCRDSRPLDRRAIGVDVLGGGSRNSFGFNGPATDYRELHWSDLIAELHVVWLALFDCRWWVWEFTGDSDVFFVVQSRRYVGLGCIAADE